MSPLSRFLLWLEPLFTKGSVGEWIMLTVFFIMPTLILIVYWRGRMKGKFLFKENYPVFLAHIGLHISDVLFSIMHRFVDILWMEPLFTAVSSLLALVYCKRKSLPAEKRIRHFISSTIDPASRSPVKPRTVTCSREDKTHRVCTQKGSGFSGSICKMWWGCPDLNRGHTFMCQRV